MKSLSTLLTLALTLTFAGAAFAQTDEPAEGEARVIAPAEGEPADEGVPMSFDGAAYTCYADGDDGAAERPVTSCYCGDGIYLGVHCAGFPGTDVCCSVKCDELESLLRSGQ